MLLLNLAIDRLLSLTTSYNILTNYYTKMYITVQLLPGCIYGGGVAVLSILMREAGRNVICTMAAPLRPPLVGICTQVGTTLCVLLIICYSLFGFFIRKLRLSMSYNPLIMDFRSMGTENISDRLGPCQAIMLTLRTRTRHAELQTVGFMLHREARQEPILSLSIKALFDLFNSIPTA
nr:unnamed protein product [Haemonchus contortus]